MFICALFAAGCSSGGSDGGFVANPTGAPAGGGNGGGNAGNGSVTFNFVRQQSNPIVVPTNTVDLRFEFFTGLQGTGTIVKSETRDFASTITIENVPASAQSAVVTAITAEGFPSAEFTANITVPVSGNVTVDATQGTTVPVNVTSLTSSPQTVALGNSDTLKVTITANFSNGDSVALTGPLAGFVTFSSNDATVVSVAADGTLTAGLNGNAVVTGQFNAPGFAAQTVDIPVVVGSGVQAPPIVVQLEIITVETQPISLPRGTVSQPFQVRATFDDASQRFVTTQNGVVFSTTNPDITVNSNQQIAIGNGADIGDSGTITATFMNASDAVQVSVSDATLDSVTVTPASVSLPFGGFEQAVVASGSFSDGTTVDLNPAQLIYTPQMATLFSVDPTTGVITSASTGTAGTANLTVQVGPTFPQQPSTTVPITVGALFVNSLTINPSVVPGMVPGDVQEFVVTANLSDGSTVDVSDFASLVITATQSPPTPPTNIVVNGKQVVAVAPTTPGQPAVATFTIANAGSGGAAATANVNITVLREILTSVEYEFGGIPVTNSAVNLPRGYVGVVEVIGTFTSGATRRLRFNEYTLDLENLPNGKNGEAITFFCSDGGMPGAPDAADPDYYEHAPTRARFLDRMKTPTPPQPIGAGVVPGRIDDFYYQTRTVQDLVTSGLQGSTIGRSVDTNGPFGVAVTRPSFRAVVADWRRTATEFGVAGGDSIAETPFLSPGAVRNVTVILNPNVTGLNPGDVSPLNETFSVTVVDPISVEVDLERTGFTNYGDRSSSDLLFNDKRIPVSAVREYEVRVNFKAVTIEDTSNGTTVLFPDIPAQGPTVDPIEGWKLAEANVDLTSSAEITANPFIFTTPTSIGFIGLTSNEEVDVNQLNVRSIPVGGDNARPVLIDIIAPTYGIVSRDYGVHSELPSAGEEPTGSFFPLRDNDVPDQSPPDFIRRLYLPIGGPGESVVDIIDPVLFTLDPINPGGTAVTIGVGASQIFRTLVRFEPTEPVFDRSLDYPPVLFTDIALPAALPSVDDSNNAAPGRLRVSGINASGGIVNAADVNQQSGDSVVSANADVIAALATMPEAIVVALDSVGRPIQEKGAFGGGIVDLRGNTGPAQSVTTIDVVP